MLLESRVVRCFDVLDSAGICQQVKALALIGTVRAHQAVIADIPRAEQPNARLSDAGLMRQAVNNGIQNVLEVVLPRSDSGESKWRFGLHEGVPWAALSYNKIRMPQVTRLSHFVLPNIGMFLEGL
jgi:hypothetical protein